MSSFLIPNGGNTTSGNKFAALDQAEPDSVDFSILGNAGRSGVFSGCVVSTISSASAVALAAGVVVINGFPYALAASGSLGVPAAPVDNRFDLVVARLSGGTVSAVVLQGTNSATNPVYPPSRDIITSVYDPSKNVDFDTDVVLAALFRDGATTITLADIVDKRTFIISSIVDQGAGAPSAGSGGIGSLYLKNTAPTTGVNSGLYVKSSTGWNEIVKVPSAGGPFWPIGMAGIWPGRGALPVGFLEAVGGTLATATYPDLFAAYGTAYGGDGVTTFGIPNYNDVFLRGTTTAAQAGDTIGQDTITLTTANLPIHNHGMAHTHTITHSHTIDHSHGPYSTSSNGAHAHSPGSLSIQGQGGRDPVLREPTYGSTNYATGYYTTGDGWVVVGANVNTRFGGGMAISNVSGLGVTSGVTATDGTHSHSITVGAFSGSTGGSSDGNTGGASVGTTGDTGGGTAHTNIPASKKVRFVLRAL